MDNWIQPLLHPELNAPQNIKVPTGTKPASRFAIYRNNVMASLIEALADTFPVTKMLVGEAFFNTMAAEFIRQCPPVSPILASYGEHMSRFIHNFVPAQTVPYLADVAALEFAYVLAFYAGDAEVMAKEKWLQLIADIEKLADIKLIFHPSLQLIASPYAIATIWAAHQKFPNMNAVNWARVEYTCIVRNHLQVEILPMGEGDYHFLTALFAGQTLGQAIEIAETKDTFDLVRCLSIFMQNNLVTSFTYF